MPGDREPIRDVGSASNPVSSSFYVVQSEDDGKASSTASDDVTQPTSNEAACATESKADGNESFYVVDKSMSVNDDNLDETTASEQATDIEQQPQDDETDVKTTAEALQPSSAVSSVNDANSLLTSIRLVIGVLSQM